MNGRTSLHKLLEAGRPPEEVGFIETTRLVRNAFAHNIEYAGLRLIDLIKLRQDNSRLIKYLSAIAKYDEAKLISDYEKDPSFLHFCIIDSTMRELFYAYLAVNEKKPTTRILLDAQFFLRVSRTRVNALHQIIDARLSGRGPLCIMLTHNLR